MAPTRYATIQKLLHWLIALVVLGMVAGGLIMAARGRAGDFGPETSMLYSMHKSTGFLLLGLMVLRLFARVIYGAPPQDPLLPAAQRLAAGASHVALYALLFAMPIVGWAAVSAGGYHEPVYGLLTVPPLDPAPVCAALAGALDAAGFGYCAAYPTLEPGLRARGLFDLHFGLGVAIVAVTALHVSGAMYHALVRRDGVMARMWFSAPPPERLG